MKTKENIYLDLSKLSGEEIKEIPQILKGENLGESLFDFCKIGNPFKKDFLISFNPHSECWLLYKAVSSKTEIALSEFRQLFSDKGESAENTNFNSLKKYFEITPKDQILKDWEETKHLDVVGVKVSDFLTSKEVLQVENNGWIKIESEKDLPKKEGKYWTHRSNGVIIEEFFYTATRYAWINFYNVTHYQPIIVPEPPKF